MLFNILCIVFAFVFALLIGCSFGGFCKSAFELMTLEDDLNKSEE